MAKKVSKFFRIAVEGDTCDGRIISAADIQDMADTFDPRVYGCRINLEHLRGLVPEGVFSRYGDVTEVKADKIDDDSALKGKLALYGKIAPLDNLIEIVSKGQKVYTSVEIQPNFANSGKCYLVGLAVTDDPASLGTEYLEFCSKAQHNPLNRFKSSPGNVFSVATLANIEFEDQPESVMNKITDQVKAIFGRKQATDDARLKDVHEAVGQIAERVQANCESTETSFSALNSEIAGLKQRLDEQVQDSAQKFNAINLTLDSTPSKTQQRRNLSTGGDAGGVELTDC
ncbi:GPO family capsid scaffolding protein [Cronobacter sakazakii]|uniref:GPO family capsid scaffolding protein n=1 Tax=Cronobacter sakazakii TaxID=28141 RepID=UPI000CF07B15|nr:GPO family capsid scaffolding protein [Cronobacter sakazakii]PPX83819.1 GPO family capsid scaffolding protein [Cronobacter sakazakii]